MGAEFQFYKQVLEVDADDGCTTMRTYVMPLKCTLKTG